MQSDRISELKIYSLGIVLTDKARNSDTIEVLPIEALPFVEGDISATEYKHKSNYVNKDGIKYESNITGNNKLLAKWIPFGNSNRLSSPDVVKNETVLLFRFADTEEYYWTTIFREPSLRRLETVHFAISDLIKGLDAFDKTSSYWLEASTHDQYVQLHTSKSNGEAFAYDIIVNAKDGKVTITDDIGNYIIIDSTENHIQVNSNSQITLTSPVVNIIANTTNISNDLNVGGNVSIAKDTSIGGSLNVGGGISAGTGGGSPSSFNGDITSTGSIIATGIVDGSNIH